MLNGMSSTTPSSTDQPSSSNSNSNQPSSNLSPFIPINYIITLPYSNIRIEEQLWRSRLQDNGCEKEGLIKSTYRQNKIPAYGPSDSQLYYPQLAAIAIDYVKNINKSKLEGRGWKRFPKNISDVKIKIIGILLSLRRLNSDNVFDLEQNVLLRMMDTQWGGDLSSDKTEDNDKLRVFGLLFHEDNSDKLHRLSVGITSRNQLEDPELSLKGIFQLLALDFNNGGFYVSLPPKSLDLDEDDLDELDPNDSARIRIKRDGMIIIVSNIRINIYFYLTNLISLFLVIRHLI